MKQRLDTPSAPRTKVVRGALFVCLRRGLFFRRTAGGGAAPDLFGAADFDAGASGVSPWTEQESGFCPLLAEGKLPEGQEKLACTRCAPAPLDTIKGSLI